MPTESFEEYKPAILKALLRLYTVWCDADHLRVRDKAQLCGEPRSMSWAEAAEITGVMPRKEAGKCNGYTETQEKSA